MSEVIGKDVYNVKGKYVGRVTDVSVDVDTKSLSAVEMKITGKGSGSSNETVLVPYELVVAIDDIVLVGAKK